MRAHPSLHSSSVALSTCENKRVGARTAPCGYRPRKIKRHGLIARVRICHHSCLKGIGKAIRRRTIVQYNRTIHYFRQHIHHRRKAVRIHHLPGCGICFCPRRSFTCPCHRSKVTFTRRNRYCTWNHNRSIRVFRTRPSSYISACHFLLRIGIVNRNILIIVTCRKRPQGKHERQRIKHIFQFHIVSSLNCYYSIY